MITSGIFTKTIFVAATGTIFSLAAAICNGQNLVQNPSNWEMSGVCYTPELHLAAVGNLYSSDYNSKSSQRGSGNPNQPPR